MQPYLSVIAGEPSLIYINGRLAGEADGENGLLLPVMPRGPVYVETRPFRSDALPQARKIVFSSGRVLPDSVGEGSFALEWPGGVTEYEILSDAGGEAEEEPPLPDGPEAVALACLFAYFAGDLPAAEMFLLPGYARQHPLDGLFSGYAGACRLKYGGLSGDVGVLRLHSDRMAQVLPVHVAGEQAGGLWRVSNFSLDSVRFT